MGFVSLLLNIGLILATTTASCYDYLHKAGCKEDDRRLPRDAIIPTHYNITLTVYSVESNYTFYGETNASIELCYATFNIKLHTKDLEIEKTATKLINNAGKVYTPTEHHYNYGNDILTIHFDDTLSSGYYQLNTKFVGRLLTSDASRQKGFARFSYKDQKGNTKWLAATCFERNGARRMFPCWDEPALKATFTISVTHHQRYRVLSNMPVQEPPTALKQNGMMQTKFRITPIMPTYLVSIVMTSDFVNVSNADKTIKVWSRPSVSQHVKFMLSIAEKIKPLLIDYTYNSEKVPKMDHVLVPNYQVAGLESWGIITYNEADVMYDNNTLPQYKKIRIASIVTHELARQWFGNLVTPSWWSSIWLREGFAVFAQVHILNEVFKDWRIVEMFVVQTLYDCFLLDVGLLTSATFEIGNSYETEGSLLSASYRKAPVLLRMLYHAIDSAAFENGIGRYLDEHEYQSTTPYDLWNAMQDALDDSYGPPKDYRIQKVMDSWFNKQHYPEVNVVRNYKTGQVTISQGCFRGKETDECADNTWWIPLTFTTQSNPDFSNTRPSHWLRPGQTITLNVNPNDWIIVNLQQIGYYRVKYDDTNWLKLARYLNSEEYSKIHVLNRAQIINDAFAFAQKNQVNSTTYVDIINYLSGETDYVAWYPIFRIFKWMSNYINLSAGKIIKLHMSKLLDGIVQSVGYDEHPDDDLITTQKRLDTLKWACKLGHAGCRKSAADKLSKYLDNPETYKISPWWKEWTFCSGVMTANRTTWDALLELYKKKSDRTILKSLSCSEDPVIIKDYLLISTLFDSASHYLAFYFVCEKHAGNDVILDYILGNIKIIHPRLVPNIVIINLLVDTYALSDEQIDKVKRFLVLNSDGNPKSLYDINQRIEKRKNSRNEAVNAFIKPFIRFDDKKFIVTIESDQSR